MEFLSKPSDRIFPQLGIKVSYLKELAQRAKEEKKSHLTLDEYLDEFIRPLTSASQCSYCEYLSATKPGVVYLADLYISLKVYYNFVEFCDGIDQYLRGKDQNIFVWISIFSNNWYLNPCFPAEFGMSLKSGIRKIGRLLVVLDDVFSFLAVRSSSDLVEQFCLLVFPGVIEITLLASGAKELNAQIDADASSINDKLLTSLAFLSETNEDLMNNVLESMKKMITSAYRLVYDSRVAEFGPSHARSQSTKKCLSILYQGLIFSYYFLFAVYY
jgi:hypothetical protein